MGCWDLLALCRPSGPATPVSVCPTQILIVSQVPYLPCGLPGFTCTVWLAPSGQGSRAGCQVQPRTLDPSTVTWRRDTDCEFSPHSSRSPPPPTHHCVVVCGVFSVLFLASPLCQFPGPPGWLQKPVRAYRRHLSPVSIKGSSEASRSSQSPCGSGPNLVRPALPVPPPSDYKKMYPC